MSFLGIHKRRTPERMGKYGEKLAAGYIKDYHQANGRYFRWIRNYTFYEGGTSHQIDYLVINSSGIFIVEVKNWEGIIKGGFNDAYWAQTKRGSRPHNLRNPIQQNIGHLHSFKRLYKGKMAAQSLVVMASNNKPQNVPGIRNNKELPLYFNQFKTLYSKETIDNEYQKLCYLKDDISSKEHIKNIKTHRVVQKPTPQRKPISYFDEDEY